MTNLFTSFDPTALSLPLNWLSSISLFLLLPPLYWLSFNQSSSLVVAGLRALENEFKQIMGPISFPGTTTIPTALMVFIVLNNAQGLAPYVFTSSSHLPFAIGLALPLWVGHMTLSWIKQPTSMLAHLVPLGTPIPLMPFMVLIEIISSLIRPLTLSIRLVANVVAGHLLLSLFGASPWAFPATLMLCALEFAVALIQAYVFAILSTLYLAEVNSKKLSLS